MIIKHTDKTYIAIYTRVLIEFYNPPEWGIWHRTYQSVKYYYGPHERYRDIDAAMTAANRKKNKMIAATPPNYIKEYKLVNITETKTVEEL